MRRDFTGVQNAFAVWETALQGCKMLSQHAPGLYRGAKCFRSLGNGFTGV